MTSQSRTLLFRAFIAALVLATLGPVASALVNPDPIVGAGGPPAFAFHLFANAGAVLGLVFTSLIAWKMPAQAGARAFALWIGFALFAWSWGFLLAGGAPLVPGGNPPGSTVRHAAGLVGAGALGAAALWFARFGLLFPRELTTEVIDDVQRMRRKSRDQLPALERGSARLSDLSPRLRRLNDANWMVTGPAGFFRSRAAWSLPIVLVVGLSLAPLVPTTIGPFLLVATLILALVVLPFTQGITFLRILYTSGTHMERRRILWLAWGSIPAGAGAAGGGGYLVGSGDLEVTSWIPVLLPASFLLLLVGVFNAVFFHGVLDPHRVIRKTVLYGGIAIAVTVAFELLQTIVSETVVAWMELPERTGGVAAAVAIALMLGPVYSKLRARTDRMFHEEGSKGELQAPEA